MRHQGVREVHSSRNLKADWELGLKKVLGREGMACEKALTEAGEGLGIKEKDTWVGMGGGDVAQDKAERLAGARHAGT